MARVFTEDPQYFLDFIREEVRDLMREWPAELISIRQPLKTSLFSDVKVCRTGSGRKVVVKVVSALAAEANILSLLKHNGVSFTPDVYAYYYIILYRVLVMERILGVPVTKKLWRRLDEDARENFKNQLARMFLELRSITSNSIQRANGYNLPNLYNDGNIVGPFETEAEFNATRLRSLCLVEEGPDCKNYAESLINTHTQSGQNGTVKFVVTHADFFPQNLLIDPDGSGDVTSIIDVGKAGFFPEYCELGIILGSDMQDWWVELMVDVMAIVCPAYPRDHPMVKFEILMLQATELSSNYYDAKFKGQRDESLTLETWTEEIASGGSTQRGKDGSCVFS
ncbi:hypothetical protein ABW19_dt0203573 [Dactylella cylindrospora]|nr:hypothetical protein ABW19_dt0203573 [Dactylella cylindrospora]